MADFACTGCPVTWLYSNRHPGNVTGLTRPVTLLAVFLLHPAVRLDACSCRVLTLCDASMDTRHLLAEVVDGGCAGRGPLV